MKNFKMLFAFGLLLNFSAMSAQIPKEFQYIVHIETGEGSNKKSCEGYLFSFQMTKDKILYSGIIADKAIITNASEIKLFLKREIGDPYLLTFPIKTDYIIQDDDKKTIFLDIPFWQLQS